MKVLDDFLAKHGIDKILHHVVGALICALISFVFIIRNAMFDWTAVAIPTIGAVVVLLLSVIKEYAFDDKVDWMDIVWAMAGCLWIYAAVAVGVLFNHLSV
jgi:hypothetical protein